MTHFAQGFLSEEIRSVRGAVRQQYPVHHSILSLLNEQCVALQHRLSLRSDKPRDLLGGALFARTLASTQAAVILLEHGLPSQANTVLRSALEALLAGAMPTTMVELWGEAVSPGPAAMAGP